MTRISFEKTIQPPNGVVPHPETEPQEQHVVPPEHDAQDGSEGAQGGDAPYGEEEEEEEVDLGDESEDEDVSALLEAILASPV